VFVFVSGQRRERQKDWPMSVLLDHPALKALEMVTEFACQACGSPAVVYPDRMSDEAPVKCQRCRTVLCTLREFRLSAEKGTAAMQAYARGSDGLDPSP
jgi:hypothetical protein